MATFWIQVVNNIQDPDCDTYFESLDGSKRSLQRPWGHVTWAKVAVGGGHWYWWNMDNDATTWDLPPELQAPGFHVAGPGCNVGPSAFDSAAFGRPAFHVGNPFISTPPSGSAPPYTSHSAFFAPSPQFGTAPAATFTPPYMSGSAFFSAPQTTASSSAFRAAPSSSSAFAAPTASSSTSTFASATPGAATTAAAAAAASAPEPGPGPWFQGGSWDFRLHHRGSKARDPVRGSSAKLSRIPPEAQTIADYWIRVLPREGPAYFWNPISGRTRRFVWSEVRWHAFKADNGLWFYWDVRSQVSQWRLPHEAATPSAPVTSGTWMKVGMTVQVNLANGRRYANSCGEIVAMEGGHVSIQLPDILGGTVLRLGEEFVRPCRAGTWVTLRGLQQTEYNNRLARVVSHTPEGRYKVSLATGSQIAVKFYNVVAASCAWNIKFDEAFHQLRVDGEQDGHFLDKNGAIRRFKLQLPAGFKKTAETGETWPLLVWMHGGGGGSFFGQSRKILQLPGLTYAHENFVVISPQCEWSWEERPDPWVAELVEYLRKASWVDPRRIYGAGSSMGGMGTLMLGTMLPHVFAALAPCASHHHKIYQDEIVQALQQMPLCFLHSTRDNTCPLEKEKPLWTKLMAVNPRILIWLNQEAHSGMRRAGFWEAKVMFDWLLAHKTSRE